MFPNIEGLQNAIRYIVAQLLLVSVMAGKDKSLYIRSMSLLCNDGEMQTFSSLLHPNIRLCIMRLLKGIITFAVCSESEQLQPI